MNLYKKIFEHFSQKDSEEGISKYFIAKNEQGAYDYVYNDGHPSWVYEVLERDPDMWCEEDILTEEEAIKVVFDAKGEINMEIELTDLYYGKTLKGWEIVKEDLSNDDIATLKRMNIIKEQE